jgi:drug/metabolite transporter (DMT)-like permease
MTSTLRVTGEHRATASLPALTVTDLLLLLMALIWGVNYVVVKFATGAFAPLAFNAVRVGLAALVLCVVVAASGHAWPRGRDWLALLGLGTLGNGLYQILFIEGIARTRAGDAALLIAASPALMAIFGWLRGSERTGPRGVVGILLSLAGIGLVVFGDQASGTVGSATLLGDALILAACVCWSIYSVLVKPYTERIDGVPLSAVTMVGGAIPMLLVALPSLARTQWTAVSLDAWSAVGYSSLVALVVGYLFWYRGVKVLGPTRAAMYSNLQPVVALLVAWAILGERPQLPQLAGAACIMAGLLLTRIDAPSTTMVHE